MRNYLFIAASSALLAGCVTTSGAGGGGTLGSAQNPVRADMPQGQRAYLNRLRCSDGSVPKYGRIGNVGVGVNGNIVDRYDVNCGSAAPGRVTIDMDMYYPGYVETQAVPGFTIVAP